MSTAILKIKDEVNVKFEGLDVSTRRKISDKLKFFVPYAYHLPAYKLGRWDGNIRFCDIGARTYLNLLDRVLPTIEENGYEIKIEDYRKNIDISFDKIDNQYFADKVWPPNHPVAGQPITLRDYQVQVLSLIHI